jgi:tetratricopeptide (TPR) repeat protein
MTVPDEIDALLMKAEDFEVRAMISDQALYQAAAKEYEKAAELSEGYYGDLREETLNIRDRWAVSLRNAGDLGKAITCDLSNLDWSLEYINRCLSRHGDNGALVLHAKQRHLNVQRRLAESYLEDKQYAEAIQRFKAVVDTNMPRSAEQICEARVDQASALFESGTDRNIMEAVNMNMVTLQRAETDLGSDHIETIKVRYNLGAELYALKKYDDALMKFGELLEILQTDYCRAKSSPDYEEYLNDAETFLLNCSAKIARRDEKIRLQAIVEAEEKARNEELENQLAEQQIVEQQVREAMAREEEMVRQQSAVEAEDRKRKEELERHLADLMEVQEAKRRQRRLEAENAAREAAEKERQKKAWLDRLDQERRDQAKRARARKDVATAISNVIGKWTNDGVLGEQAVAQNMPSQQISPSKASPGVGAEEYFASPGTTSCSGEMIYVDCEDKVDVVGTTADNEEPSEMTTHSGSICNTSHRPDLTKADLLQVQHVEALSTETVGDQSNEEPDLSDSTTKSIRSEATVGAAMIPGNVTEKLEVENEVLEEQEQQFADNPSMAEAQRVPVTELNNGMRIVVAERLTKIPELWQELRRKNTFELFAAASRSKSKPENCPRSVFGSARSTAIESGSRRHSAPSTKLPELGASIQRGNLEYVHGHPNVISKAHEPVENERPESPQSDYRTASPSSPARRPSSTEDINERLQHETFGELHKTLVSVSSSGSAGVADSMEASPDQVQDHVVSANSKTSNLAKRSLENPMLSLTSLGDTWSTSSPIEDTSLRGIVAEVSGTDDTTSEAEVERLVGKQSQPVTPSMLFSAVRTDTLKSNSSERNVPGGWHQDFDEPETVRSLRRSRSSDQQGGGGLRISQTEDTYHRRASSVGLSGASMPETPTSPIRNWSHQE